MPMTMNVVVEALGSLMDASIKGKPGTEKQGEEKLL